MYKIKIYLNDGREIEHYSAKAPNIESHYGKLVRVQIKGLHVGLNSVVAITCEEVKEKYENFTAKELEKWFNTFCEATGNCDGCKYVGDGEYTCMFNWIEDKFKLIRK